MTAPVAVAPLAVADPLSADPALALELEQRWLVWDSRVAGERRVDLHPLVLGERAHAEAVSVAERAAALVFRAGDRAAASAGERALYRLHPDVVALAAAARAGGDRSTLVRVDLLLRDDGRFVACEVNADCPGGHNETLALPRLARAAGFRGGFDPTNAATRLADRLVALSGGPGSPRGAIGLVCATAYAEDLQVSAIMERLVVERGGRAMRFPVTAPKADGDGVAVRGKRVSVIHRFYPLEYMASMASVEAMARATERGALASVSAFSAIYPQSKLAMARAFEAEPELAREVFPETVAFAGEGRGALAAERAAWVLKRDLSRVGDHVIVGALETDEAFAGALGDVTACEEEGGEVWIAQRFVPPGLVGTPWGPRCLTLGVYLLDGVFAGYLARLSRVSLCSHDALVLPVFVGERGERGRPASREGVAA